MRNICLPISVCVLLSCSAAQTPIDPTPKTDDRLESCRDTLTDENTDLGVVLSACSRMWRKPTCSTAWIEGLEMPGYAAAEHIITTCKVAYCSGGEHAICVEESAVDLTDEEVDWLWLWTDLNTVILREDLDGRVEAPEAGQFAKLLLTRMIFRDTSREP